MPAKVKVEGDLDAKVPFQVRIPLRLKLRIVEHAKALGKDMTDFVQDVLREATEGKPKKR